MVRAAVVSALLVLSLTAGNGDALGQWKPRPATSNVDAAAPSDVMNDFTHQLQSLRDELSAVRSENSQLRLRMDRLTQTEEIVPVAFSESSEAVCETCQDENCDSTGSCDTCTDCGWIDQLSNQCRDKLSWNKGDWRIVPFGQLRGEAIYATHPTTADAVIFFLNPTDPRFTEDQFTVHGKTSMLNFAITGPTVGGFQVGGGIIMNFLGPQPLRNNSGVNVLNAYAELKNDQWRFAFGRMFDLFSPIQPNTVNLAQQRGAGNVGIFRGAFHFDRYITCQDCSRLTLSGRISQQDVNDFLVVPTVRGTDDGIPNFEGRVGYEFGPEIGGRKVFEVGLSGLVGRTRAVDPVGAIIQGIFLPPGQAVSDTWGANIDLQVQLERMGFRGELWKGQAAGTYFVGALQSLNPILGTPIRSQGGWGEVYVKPADALTLYAGYGIDDPRNEDLGFFTPNGPGQRSRNQVVWGTVAWDLTNFFQIAFEVSHRETDYLSGINSSDAMLYHFASTLTY